MNIFYVNQDPVTAAQELVDKHVVKMPLETAQMLCSAFPQGTAPYRRTHFNHPSTMWSRQSLENYQWLINHGLALCSEYTHRYGKEHKSKQVIEWCKDNVEKISFEQSGFSDPPQCIPDDSKDCDHVKAYRSYYNKHKSYMFSWKNRTPPDWANIHKT